MLGATTTADEVLDGRDLSGQRVLVTGASAGVGSETARVLAAHGACVIGTARDPVAARAAVPWAKEKMRGQIDFVELDLASLRSVQACADALLAKGEPLDVIIANAGVMAAPKGITEDGFETQFGTNYVGHFALVNSMAALFQPGSRLVMVSSAGHRGADIDLDDPDFTYSEYDPLVAYRRSKTATVLFMVAFDRRHRAADIRATAVHPGAVLTDTTRKLIEAQPSAAAAFTWKTVAQGAATSVWAGLVAPADQVGGRYCEDCHVADVTDDPSAAFGVRSYALDPDRADALWRDTEATVRQRSR